MHALAMLMCGAFALCATTGMALADVSVSRSNDPNAGYAAQLRTLLEAEKTGLASKPPSALAVPVKAAAKPGTKPVFEDGWLATLPPASGGAEWRCLAEAVYFEARGESLRGQFAVAEVILNRVESPKFPSTVCGVVRQGAGGKGGCQFSYVCDGKSDRIREAEAWDRASKIARLMIDGSDPDLTQGATHFHTTKVRPNWASRFPQTARIGTHLFYRKPGAMPTFGPPKAAAAEQTATTSSKGRLAKATPALQLKGEFAISR